jgi:hypothetical protein
MTAAAGESMTDGLLDRAEARGQLPVLVGLRFPREGAGADPSVAIAALRARLFADLGIHVGADGALTGPGIANVKPFDSIPFVALTVEPPVLERLLRHPLVASVVEDTAVPPS